MNERIGVGLSGVLAMTSLLACQPAERLEAGSSGLSGVAPVVAVRSGHAVAAWHRSGQVRVSGYEVGATWSAPQILGTGNFPLAAAASSGDAVVVYGSSNSLFASVRSAASWSAPELLGSAPGLSYGVAQQGSGRAIAVWSGGSGGVQARTREGGAWQAAETLSPQSIQWPQVAINDSGVAFAAWCGVSGSMWGARRVYPGAWEGAVTSMPLCCQGPVFDTPGPSVSVGVDASGQAVIVGSSGTRLCEKRFIPGSGWQGTMVLATPGPDGAAPQLAVNPSGQALLAWTVSGGDKLVKARAYQPGSGWGPILVGPAAGTGRLGVGIGSTGNGAILYRSPSATLSAVVYTGGALTAPSVIASGSGAGDSLYYLKVGFDPSESSQGVAVWQRAVGGEEVWASRLGL
jgi:hypothetical protein